MATYAYITNNEANDASKPRFESELDDDQIAFAESMKRGYLTRDESIYFGSKQFDLDGVAVRQD